MNLNFVLPEVRGSDKIAINETYEQEVYIVFSRPPLEHACAVARPCTRLVKCSI